MRLEPRSALAVAACPTVVGSRRPHQAFPALQQPPRSAACRTCGELTASRRPARGRRSPLAPSEVLRSTTAPGSKTRCESLSSDGMPLNDEDLHEVERNGRRCGVCRSGRRWRDFEVVREEGREPVVMCVACRARHGQIAPVRKAPEAAPPSVTQPSAAEADHHPEQREDRLKKALGELPRGEYTTGRIAKAAGLNHDKAVVRLQQLEEAGEIRQVGNRWSTEPVPTDLEGAFDRLQARTSNLRIVRDRTPVG